MGHFEKVKYLVQLGIEYGNLINIYAYGDEAFRLACDRGYLDIVKYLVSLNPDIYSYEIMVDNVIQPIILNQ